MTGARFRRLVAAAGLAVLCACDRSGEPRHFLVITHSALNRVTFFDLDRCRVAGVLPAQKLPHDLLLAPDQKSILVVNSGAQCMTRYHLDSPELWRRARAFLRRDTTRVGSPPSHVMSAGASETGTPDTRVLLHPDPVQEIPPAVADFHLTDPTFPDTMNARAAHERTGAFTHHACFDCHERSRGTKPFAPVYTGDGRSIALVQLAAREITFLDATTLEVRRQIPLDLPRELAPVEVWIRPGTDTAFVTCRNAIGESRPGRILVVDLASGRTLRSLAAGIFPWHLLPVEGGRRLVVNNFQSSRLSIVDVARAEIVDSVVVQNGPSMMMLAPDGRRLFVSCFYTHRLLVVDLPARRVEKVIPVGSNPTSMLLEADGRHVEVLCGGESELQRLDWRSGLVVERDPLLFGAYAFRLVNLDHARRWIAASGPPDPAGIGERP